MQSLGVRSRNIDIDLRPDMEAVQKELGKITGAETVPRVFIAGSFLGGSDDMEIFSETGKLQQLCRDCGAL